MVLDDRAGGGCFSVWYVSMIIELKPGMTAISVNKRDDLPDAIRSIIAAVRQGELDIQIENVAEKGKLKLGLRVSGGRSIRLCFCMFGLE